MVTKADKAVKEKKKIGKRKKEQENENENDGDMEVPAKTATHKTAVLYII